ncbi:MAG: TonB-dependent receptor [Bryobacteraceae bacterium]|nr:TonB-dependent receptor [Bryobacteraceae bacterium]
MRLARYFALSALCLTLAAVCPLKLSAQSDSARLQGVIADQTKAFVPAATVRVTDLATNRTLETTSADDTGAWSFPVLPPGNYSIEVTKDGFRPIQQKITLQVAQVANVEFVLEPGTVSEQIVVTAEAGLVDSASSDLGATVESKQIRDLPLNGRNFTQLATLLPGVNRGVPDNVATGQGNNAETFRYNSSGGAALVVNGARPQANNFMLDGVDNNESLVNTIVFFPSAEAIQEFKVQTSIASAEFGRAGGAIVNSTLKSGSNEFHGSAFEFIRNSELDARPTFAPERATFRRNQFGGTLSGPIIKNRLFVFGDYQGFRQSTPVGVDFATVPTALMRKGDFSELLNTSASGLSQVYTIKDLTTGLPFSGNIIPGARQNSVGLKYLNAYPTPNISGKVQQNYVTQRQQSQNFDDFDIRGDWNASEVDRVFARFSYAHDKEDTTSRLPQLPAGYGSGDQYTYAHGAVVGFTHIFNPTLVNDLRLGFQRTNLGYEPPMGDVPVSQNLGIPNANTSSLLGGGALIGGYNSQLEYTGDYGSYKVPQNTYQVADIVSWSKDRHIIKFGANIIWRQVNMFRPKAGKGYFFLWGNGSGPGSSGYEVADILAGFVNNYQIGAQTGMFGTRSWENGLFLQDDWRVTRRLTVNLGVRYDVLTNPTEVYARQSNFDLQTSTIRLASSSSDPLANNNYHNFAPRVGFAYDVTGKGQTVVRGGYGVFYFLDRGGIDNQLSQNAPFSGISQYNYTDGYRITLSGQAPSNSSDWMTSTGALPAAGFRNFDAANPKNISMAAVVPDNKTSTMQQWNIQLQHQLPKNVVAKVAYVGAAGHHLIDRYNISGQLFNTPAGTHLYPGMGDIHLQEARGNSIYHGLQAEVSRRFAEGLQFTAAYTFSRTVDDGSGAFASEQVYESLRFDRALSDQHVKQRLVVSSVYELPFGKGRRFLHSASKPLDLLAGGWQLNTILTLQSGLPFSLSTPGTPAGRPDLVGELKTDSGNTERYFTTSAVAQTPRNSSGVLLRQGTLGRNVLIGPGIATVDLSAGKTIPLWERFKIEFRAEAFNLFNHPVYRNPNTDISAGNFGKITATHLSSERQLQGVVRISF